MTKLIEEALGGLSAGVVGTVIGYPLDLVKTRMQTTTTTTTASSSSSSKSVVGVAREVVQKEGVLALYRGIAPPLISLSILNTINFTSYSYVRTRYGGTAGWDIRNGFAGMTVGPIAGMVSTIENLVKTQMQLDNVNEKRFRSSWNCVTTLVKEHGVLVLYTGHGINTAREGVFLATYFYIYEGLREFLLPRIGTTTAVPIAGGLSGATAWFVSFPLDCIRARVQGKSLLVKNKTLTKTMNAFSVTRDIMVNRGFLALYSGVTPSIVRAFLVSGSRFSAYEGALWLLGTDR